MGLLSLFPTWPLEKKEKEKGKEKEKRERKREEKKKRESLLEAAIVKIITSFAREIDASQS